MKDDDLASIKQAIESQLCEVRDEIANLESFDEPLSEDRSEGRLGRMAAIARKNMSDAALENANVRLTQLEQALVEIDAPDYGSCMICGTTIPIARLLLMPASKICVKCAERQEG